MNSRANEIVDCNAVLVFLGSIPSMSEIKGRSGEIFDIIDQIIDPNIEHILFAFLHHFLQALGLIRLNHLEVELVFRNDLL